MEVKVNKEIRGYTESMFFGLSLRQCVFSVLAIGVAVGIYFGLRTQLGTETVSWVCVLGAAPFGAMGFITYHGMTAEQFLWAWFKSEFLMPKQLRFHPTNLYYEAVNRSSTHRRKITSARRKNKVLKTLKAWIKENKEQFKIPKGVQSVIPVHAIYEDGIFLVRRGGGLNGDNKYSKTYRFTDINYAVASKEDKEAMFLQYAELLNSLDCGAAVKITIRARRLSKADYEANILIPLAGDDLDKYRKELNAMLLKKVTEAGAIVLDKLVTLSVCEKNIECGGACCAQG